MRITIEKLIYGGDGLARLAPDSNGKGKALFVPFVLAGEEIEAELTEERPGFVRARSTGIVTPSTERIAPRCPLFGSCGGCHYQHTNYANQLAAKKQILLETLRRTAKLELPCELEIVSGEPWQFRNRTRLKLQTEPEFAAGYFRNASHELMPVRECPISSPLINRAIAAIWDCAGEFTGVPAVREVQLFANHDDRALMLELYAERAGDGAAFAPLHKALSAALPELIGLTVFQYAVVREDDEDRPPVAARSGPVRTFGERSMQYRVGEHGYKVSAGAFFQTNRFLGERLVETVTADYTGQSALDLFAGTGLFSLALASRFERVTAVEASPFSAPDLRHNAVQTNVKAIERDTFSFLQAAAGAYDLVVVDPPRAGLGERTARALGALHTPRIVYVSCDPSTLSRDLRVLLELGFRVERAAMVDLFPQTFHMESVFHLVRD